MSAQNRPQRSPLRAHAGARPRRHKAASAWWHEPGRVGARYPACPLSAHERAAMQADAPVGAASPPRPRRGRSRAGRRRRRPSREASPRPDRPRGAPPSPSASTSSSDSSATGGTTATASSSRRAVSSRRAARASTASRTVSGIAAPPAASTSVTKNGFPAVRRCSSSGAVAAEGPKLRDGVDRQRPQRDPLQARPARELPEHHAHGCVRSSWSSRKVARTSAGSAWIRRAEEEADDVEGGLVSPVQVLDDEDRRVASGQLPRPSADTSAAGPAHLARLRLELARRAAREIQQRNRAAAAWTAPRTPPSTQAHPHRTRRRRARSRISRCRPRPRAGRAGT